MKPKVLLWAIVAVLVVAVGVMLFKPSGGSGIQNVDAAGAQKAIDAGAQIVDVRTAGEFQMGHIPGAVNVPVDQLEAQAASWDKTKTYVVYCATGSRSATAVDIMSGLGFKNIAHLSAGIQSWPGKLDTGMQSSNQKIETNGKPVFVEFYTNSWPSCQKMKPLVEGLEKQYEGKVEFRRLNVETDQAGVELANSLGVQYVPTFLYVNTNGIIAQQTVGEQTQQQLVEQLDKLQ